MAWSTMEEEMTVRDALERQRRAIELDTLRQRVDPKEEGWAGVERQTPEGMSKWYGNRPSPEQQLANQAIEAPDLLTSILVPEPADIVGGLLAKPVTTAFNKAIMAPLWPKVFSEVVSRSTNPVFQMQYEPTRKLASKLYDVVRGGDYTLQKYQDAIDTLVDRYPALQNISRLDKGAMDWLKKVGNPQKLEEYYGNPATWSNVFELNPDYTYKDVLAKFLRRELKDIGLEKLLPEGKAITHGRWSNVQNRAQFINPLKDALHEYGAHGLQFRNEGIDTLSQYANAELTPEIEKELFDLGYEGAKHGNETLARIMDIGQGMKFKQEPDETIYQSLGPERIGQYLDAIRASLINPDITQKDIIKIMGPAKSNPSRGPVGKTWEDYTKVALEPVSTSSFAGWTKKVSEPTQLLTTVLPGPDDVATIVSRRAKPTASTTKVEKPTTKVEGRFAKPAMEWTSEARWGALEDEGPFAIEIVRNQSLRYVQQLKNFYKDDRTAIRGLSELEGRLMTGPDNMIPAESNNVHAWLRKAATEEAKRMAKGGKK